MREGGEILMNLRSKNRVYKDLPNSQDKGDETNETISSQLVGLKFTTRDFIDFYNKPRRFKYSAKSS